MVECSFLAPDYEEAWNKWYEGHLLNLLTVPGVSTAQRYRLAAGDGATYCALYTVTSPEVFNSPEYAAIKGGNFPPEWRDKIGGWKRIVLDGLARAPDVPRGSYLLVVDAAGRDKVDGLPAEWTTAIALDRAVGERALGVVNQDQASGLGENIAPVSLYEPISKYLTTDVVK